MGISFSCPFADYDDLEKDFETLVVRSISFKGDELETTLRSVSFNGRDSEPTIMKSLGSGKMIIEGSVSFKSRDSDPFHLETMISIKTPSLPKESALKSASFKGREIADPNPAPNTSMDVIPNFPSLKPSSPKHEAAVTLQKVYKSFRTRRRLADCAVLVEQRWWKLLDFAVLKRSSVSFFDIEKPESAFSRWSRARTRAAKVGKGLSKDLKARKLALQHWLEAIDPRHRYGHNLHFYYDSWLHCESRQPFFYWLDVGEGKEVNLVDQCPRSKLQQQCIKYLGPKERETFEVVVKDGKFFYKQDNKLLDTSEGPKNSKWIFVLSTSKNLYVGQKKKGTFQHSSFLAGGATSAAGRLVVENGILKAVWPHSGHYQPTEENFQEFVTFLKEHDVDLTDVKNSPTEEDDDSWSQHGSHHIRSNSSQLDLSPEISNLAIDNTEAKQDLDSEQSHVSENGTYDCCKLKHTDWLEISQTEGQAMSDFSSESQSGKDETVEEESSASEQHYMFHKRNLFEEDHQDGEQEAVPHESILLRINSRKGMKSLQLGKQLSFKWTTGAGPRIGCVRDYPTELQFRALEQVNLSPRTDGNSRAFASPRSTASPRPRTPTASLLKENSSNSNNQC